VNISHIISSDGYWALSLLIGLEAFGIPFPGETVLVTAGAYAGQTHKLSIWVIWICAVASIELGSSLGYWIGVRGGYRILRKYGKYIRMREPEIKVGLYVFDRYGPIVVSAGRFVAVLRTYAPFLAGTNRMKWPKFGVYNLAGALAWSALWAFLSYAVGNSLKHASSKVNLIVGIAAVVLVVVAVLVVRRQAKRLEAVAEAAYPGPLPD
jgi:membrane protein DedA with SNARE-associated domain